MIAVEPNRFAVELEALRPVGVWRTATIQDASVRRDRLPPGPYVAFGGLQMYPRYCCPCGRAIDHPTAPTAAG